MGAKQEGSSVVFSRDGLPRISLAIQDNIIVSEKDVIVYAVLSPMSIGHPHINNKLGYYKYFSELETQCIYDFYAGAETLVMIIKPKFRSRYNITKQSLLESIT